MNYQGSRRGCRAVLALVALILFAAVGVLAQEPESNLDVMVSLTEDVATDLAAALEPARRGRALRLVTPDGTEEYRLIETVFTSVLTERGIEVYRPVSGPQSAEGQSGVLELQLQVNDFTVGYPGIFRSYLIGGKKVRRSASVVVVATLIDPATGAVLGVKEASRAASDEVAHGDLAGIEEGAFQFLRPEVPSSGWTRVVEPVFVSGIIVGLIYLFFSNQSD